MRDSLILALSKSGDLAAVRTALIVDDNPTDRLMIGRFTEKVSGLRVVYASNGQEALQRLRSEKPSVVLTDLQMEGMNGLELVEAMRVECPETPVILMTAVGSEEVALAALRAGAISYIPKRELTHELARILFKVLHAARTQARRHRLIENTTSLEWHLVLDSDPLLLPLLVTQMQEYALHMGLVNRNGMTRLAVALEEALLNGIYHGNLEILSEQRLEGASAFTRLADLRRHREPYASRRLHVDARLNPQEATFVIRDEGPGFDLAALPDPTDPENMLHSSRRGLVLIRTFMDEVRHNASGNEITLVKRRL